mgnify:CR=1 FL=1
MVHKCIKCRKIIDSTRIYCKACEAQIKQMHENKKKKEELWENSDFFQRQRLK